MDVEIFIPTKDRPEFLSRTLFYYNKKSDVIDKLKIYIADSSNETNFLKNKETILKLKPHLIITHDRYVDNKTKNLGAKLVRAVKKITGKYIISTGDDDFAVVENILPCYQFLEQHDNYIVCGGARADFMLEPLEGSTNNAIAKCQRYKITGLVSGPYWPENDPLARFISYMQYGVAIQHYMIRGEVFKNIHDYLIDDELCMDQLFGIEVLICALIVLSGNIKRLDHIITIMRQAHDSSTRPSMVSFMESDNSASIIKKSKNIIVDKLCQLGYDLEFSKYITDREFSIRLRALIDLYINQKSKENNTHNNFLKTIDDKLEEMQDKYKWIPPTQFNINETITNTIKECVGVGINKVPLRL